MADSAKYRVLVDWNKDGWFDGGVDTSTPLNIVPDALWGIPNVENFSYDRPSGATNSLTSIPKIFSPNPYGFSEIKAENRAAGRAYLGFKGFQKYQVNDDDNSPVKSTPLISGGASMNFSLFKLSRLYQKSSGDLFIDDPVVLTTGLLPGGGAATDAYIGYNGTTYTPIVSVTAGVQYQMRIGMRKSPYHTPTSGVSVSVSLLTQTGAAVTTTLNTGSLVTGGFDLEFTAPVGMTGLVVKIHITTTAPDNLEVWIQYLNLYVGAYSPSLMYSYNVDPAIKFTEEQFSVVLSAGQAYTATVWFKETNGLGSGSTGNKNVVGWVCPIGTNTYTKLTPVSIATTYGAWSLLSFQIPSQASKSGFFLDVTISSVRINEFSGYQVVPGTVIVPFNTGGSTSHYENITPYVKQVTWKSGKNALEDGLPFEGEAQLSLNNESRLFSPSNVDSPLYGLMDRGLRVQIQTKWNDYDDWDNRWTGWTDTYEVDPGTNGERETLLRAVQGINRMRDGKLWFLNTEDADFNDTVQSIINESGWLSSGDAATSLVGFQTLVDVNAFVADPDTGWALLQDAVGTVDFVGFGWNEKTLAKDAINDLLTSQDAHLFINRDGKLELYNRNHFINVWLNYDYAIDLNEYPNVHYQYGENIINSVSVTIQRKRAEPSGVLWETKRAIKVFPKSVRELTVNYQFDEGGAKTPLDLSNAVFTIYASDPGLSGTVAPEPSSNALSAVAYGEITRDGSTRTVLRLHNDDKIKTYWFNVTINGTSVDRGDNETLVVDDADAIQELNEIQKTNLSNDLIGDQPAAFNAAWTLLGRRSRPAGEFDKFGFYIEDNDLYDLMQSLTLAKRLVMEEYQTGETNLQHVILEENGSIVSGGLMKIEYTVKRTDQTKYAYVEGTMTPKYDNLIWDFPIVPTFDGIVTPVSDQMQSLDTGVYGADFYVGAKVLDVSLGGQYSWMDTGTGGKPIETNTQGGLVYSGAAGEPPVFLSSVQGSIPLEPLEKYYFNCWLYAGSDFSGSGSVFRASNWAGSGFATTITATSTTPSMQLKRDNQFKMYDHFYARPLYYTGFGASYTPGWANFVKALADQIYLDSSKTYTVSLYARPGSGYAATSYTLEVFDQTGAILASGSSSFNSGGIDRLDVTFTTASAVYFRIKNTVPQVKHILNVYGLKMLEGSTPSSTPTNIPNPDFLYLFV